MSESSQSRIKVLKGDITRVNADAIVNAANSSLMGGGGVDGAIHRAGGPAILEACKELVRNQGECETGDAVITTAGNLPANYVIHTVGPIWRGGEDQEEESLYSAYYNSLLLAAAHDCRVVAFPNISTGVYGFPKRQAATIAVRAVYDFLSSMDEVQQVLLVCFDEENYYLTKQAVDGLTD